MNPISPEAVSVVNIVDLLDTLFGARWYEIGRTLGQEEIDAGVMAWCKEHKAHYYAAPREDFSCYTAQCEAAEKGLEMVVVEDLS